MEIISPGRLKKGAHEWIDFLLPILATIAIVIIIWKLYQASKQAANAAGETLSLAGQAAKTGISVNRLSYIKSKAQDLWNNGVDRPWYALWMTRNYDEQMFIDALNEMNTRNEVAMLDQYYKSFSGERLRTVIEKSFDATEKAKIFTSVYNALP